MQEGAFGYAGVCGGERGVLGVGGMGMGRRGSGRTGRQAGELWWGGFLGGCGGGGRHCGGCNVD